MATDSRGQRHTAHRNYYPSNPHWHGGAPGMAPAGYYRTPSWKKALRRTARSPVLKCSETWSRTCLAPPETAGMRLAAGAVVATGWDGSGER